MTQATFPKGATVVFGATGGIGKVVAEQFATAGSEVAVIWNSKQDVADTVVTQIAKAGGKASAHHCDVSQADAVHQTISNIIQQHGRIHTLVWGAGPLAEQVLISECTREQWHTAFNIEVHGFYEACQAVLPHMRDQGGGAIVHLGSAGDLSFPERDMLSVTPKAANESLVKGIAREEGRHNVRANSVLIGVIEAGMFLELTKQGVFDKNWVDEVQKNLALKRWGQPEEIASAAIFLASDQAAYITGQQIAVAGGYGL